MRTFFLYVLLWPLAGVFAQVAGPPEATPAKTPGGRQAAPETSQGPSSNAANATSPLRPAAYCPPGSRTVGDIAEKFGGSVGDTLTNVFR